MESKQNFLVVMAMGVPRHFNISAQAAEEPPVPSSFTFPMIFQK